MRTRGLMGLAAAAAVVTGLAATASGDGVTAVDAAQDEGWIYYFGYENSDRAVFRSAPDGTVSETVADAPVDYGCDIPECNPGSGDVGVPSHETHDGDRWYVAHRWTSPDVIFPNVAGPYSQVALDVEIVREGDSAGITLTNSKSSCLYVSGMPQWAPDSDGHVDGAVSWLGAQWADLDGDPDCETFVQAGVFRAELTYGAAGAITGAAAPVLEVPLEVDDSNNLSDVPTFDWSPDGASVAYITNPQVYAVDGYVFIANVGDPVSSHTPIVAGSLSALDWSPDMDPAPGLQTSIVFSGRRGKWHRDVGMWRVDPDGSDLTLLKAGRDAKNQSQTSIYLIAPLWSTDGAQVAYVERESVSVTSSTRSLRVIGADGTGDALLAEQTATTSVQYPLAWTASETEAPPTGNAPTADAGGPYSGTEDIPVAFDATSSTDPDGDSLTYTWHFGDGTSGTGATPSHTYLWGGTFSVTVEVSDGNGNSDTATATVTVAEVNDAPVADAGGPYSGNVGDSIAFDGSGSSDYDNYDGTSANDQVLTYSWTFGDGGTGSGAAPSHTYASDGGFAVSLTVSDGTASTAASATADITVAPANPSVTGITPDTMSAGGSIAATISGSGFQPGATVTFANGSGPAPTAGSVVVAGDGNSISLTISVSAGGPKGTRVWDVVVTNTDAGTDTLANGFTVVK
ncbi:MAG: PKD domain-containing protein [Anaerolineae bacterium]